MDTVADLARLRIHSKGAAAAHTLAALALGVEALTDHRLPPTRHGERGPSSSGDSAGDALFTEGAAAHHVFIINGGSVQIRKRVFEEEVVLETLGKGNICGDVAIAADATYVTSCVALDTVQAVVVHRDNIQSVMLSNPSVVERLFGRMAARLAQAQFRVSALSMADPLARVMLQLRREVDRADADPAAFCALPYDLGEALGIEPNLATRAPNLIRDGLIDDGAGRFRIHRPDAFARRPPPAAGSVRAKPPRRRPPFSLR